MNALHRRAWLSIGDAMLAKAAGYSYGPGTGASCKRVESGAAPLLADPVKNRPEKLEAAGIEPASRDRSGRVSTCVVRLLFLDADAAGEQAAPESSSTVFSHRAAEQHTSASLLIVA